MTEWQWGQVGIIATTVATFLVSEWRAHRKRREDLQDRKEAREVARAEREASTRQIVETAKAQAEADQIRQEAAILALRHETFEIAERLRIQAARAALVIDAKQTEGLERVHSAIADVKAEAIAAKEASATAIAEANHVNEKLVQIGVKLTESGIPPVTVNLT